MRVWSVKCDILLHAALHHRRTLMVTHSNCRRWRLPRALGIVPFSEFPSSFLHVRQVIAVKNTIDGMFILPTAALAKASIQPALVYEWGLGHLAGHECKTNVNGHLLEQ